MITAIYIGTKRLDLFKDEIIVIKSSVAKIEDITKVFTDTSNNFSVPATDNNNSILKHFYNQNLVDGLDLRKSLDAVIELDGVFYKKGRIQASKVELESRKPISYSLDFYGNLVSLKDIVKEFKLSDLNLSAYNFTFSSGNALAKIQAKGDVSATLFSKKRRYIYDSSMAQPSNATQANLFYNNADALSGVDWTELNYSIKDIRIIEAIEADYNITFSRDFFGLNDFLNIYTLLSASRKNIQSQVPLTNNLDSDPTTSGNTMLATGFGTTPQRETRLINFEVIPTVADNNKPYNMYIKNGNTIVFKYSNVVGTRLLVLENTDVAGDLENITFWIEALEPISYNSNIQREQTNLNEYRYTSGLRTVAGTYKISENMPEQKVIDYLKGLFQQYKLIAIVQDDDTIYVDTLNNYYRKGSVKNYTKHIDFEKTTVSKGLLLNKINFKFSEPQTILAEQFLTNNKISYGDLELEILDDNGEIVEGESLDFELPFEQVVYERLSDVSNGVPDNIQITYALLTDDTFKEVKIKQHRHYISNRILTNPLKLIDFNSIGQAVYNLNIPSHTNTIIAQNFSTTFGEEFEAYNGSLITETLYTNFHKEYILEVFNKNRRNFNFTCKNLPLNLITKTQLNDVIEINGDYYRINSIDTNIITNEVSLNLYNIANLNLTPL